MRSRHRAAVAAALAVSIGSGLISPCLAIAAPISASTPTPTVTPEPGQLLVAQVIVNEMPLHDAVIIVRDHDVLIRLADCADLPIPGGIPTQVVKGIRFVSLASTGLKYAFDPSAISLNITHFQATRKSVQIARQAIRKYSGGRSAYVNYMAMVDRMKEYAYETQFGFAGPRDQLTVGYIADNGPISRQEVQYQYRTADDMGVWTLGDQWARSSLGAASRPFFGLSFARGFEDRQAAARNAPERILGYCEHACKLMIQEGDDEKTIDLPPGPVTISNVPQDAQLNLEDEITAQMLPLQILRPQDSGMLEPGFTQYSLAAGLNRTCIFLCAAYGGFEAQANMMHGFGPWFSAGADVQIDQGAGLGLDALYSNPYTSIRLAAGVGPRASDLLSYSTQTGPFWLTASYGVSGMPYYSPDFYYDSVGRTRTEAIGIGYHGTAISASENFQPGQTPFQSMNITQRIRLGATTIFIGLQHSNYQGASHNSVNISVPVQIARHGNPTMLSASIGGGRSVQQQVYQQINTPSGVNLGISSVPGQYQIGYRGDAFSTTINGLGMLITSGGVVIQHGPHLANEPQNGTVVIEGEPGDVVMDQQGVRHVVGHSGFTAFPFAAGEKPQELRVVQPTSIDDMLTLDTSEVFPAPYSTQVVHVKHHHVHAIIGNLGQRAAFGELTLFAEGKTFISPIGSSGEFYFTDLPLGTWKATARITGGSCTTTLTVPDTKLPQIDLGDIPCV